MQRSLGTCYYPEHWPKEIWADDAKRMANAGLTWIRIGEFAWKRLEPSEGEFEFEWLDEAIDILGRAGLKVVLGTPTATPPKWVLDKYPDMLAVDIEGRLRRFGSRRHYCFSHQGYIEQCRDIVTRLAQRYGGNPYVQAWQIDNEYGCHNTSLSYSDAARKGFQEWLRAKFPSQNNNGDIEALNKAWGNVFWSMDYAYFEDIDLPNLTVTEPNPAHVLAFRHYTSDQIVRFNQAQLEIIKRHSQAPVTHNYMGRITDFDHFKVGSEMDFASWDSYPLGFLEDRVGATVEDQKHYARQGHPDFQAFHHDLYRAVGKGRWWVMEQQPGPVNWAPYNPAPLDGMVRLWTWEAFAHGAEAICYFRWRQAPFAQEQLHSGLLRPDSVAATGLKEAQKVAQELTSAPTVTQRQASVAIVFDYAADAAWDIQPHGQGLSYFGLVFDCYCALRKLGLSIDFLSAETRDFSAYKLVLAPGMMHMPNDLKQALAESESQVILGPRSGARDIHMTIPTPLPPDFPGLDVTVTAVQSLRPDLPMPLSTGGAIICYHENLESSAEVVLSSIEGHKVAVQKNNLLYLGAWLDQEGFLNFFEHCCITAGITTIKMPKGVRRRLTGCEEFWFNYNPQAVETNVGNIMPADFIKKEISEKS